MDRPNLLTARLKLRATQASDATRIQRLAGDAAVADTVLNIPHPYEDGMAESWIAAQAQAAETGERLSFAVVERASDDLVGAASLRIEATSNMGELGYWVGREYWGRGFATEASQCLVDYAFAVLKLNRVRARHLPRNPASGRVMQKIGMQLEGRLRDESLKDGRYEDLLVYGLLRSEWSASGGAA